jgi:diadenylate cyclase
LHDGAVVIRQGRIRAASCVLPLSTKDNIDKQLGTRHRAAMGISEVTDGIAVVVSEESGQISYVNKGDIIRNVSAETLKKGLKDLLKTRSEVSVLEPAVR